MIPFTADVFFQLIAQYNAALWPIAGLLSALALIGLALSVWTRKGSDRFIAAVLGIAWLWTGIVFHLSYFGKLNFVAPVFAWFFVVQGVLFLWCGLWRGGLQFRLRADVYGWTGLAIAVTAVAVVPLLALQMGYDWASVRLFATAPAPLALFTLAMLLLREPRVGFGLLTIPLAWSLWTGVTAWELMITEDLLLPIAGVLVLFLGLIKNSRQRVSEQSETAEAVRRF